MTRAIVGGNCNNGLHCGALCSNVNNLASNTNWNVGATKSYSSMERKQNAPLIPQPLLKINPTQGAASSVVENCAGDKIRKGDCMKSYGNLYEPFLSDENIKLAIIESSRDKRDRPFVNTIYENPDLFVEAIRKYADGFKNEHHNPVEIFDGIKHKKRKIIVPAYSEQIVHHMFIQILKPIIMKGMYKHSYGSIPGVGGYDGAKVIKKWIEHDAKNVKYCLKMDIYHFYPTADQQIFKRLLQRTIRDSRFLQVGYEIVGVVPVGFPLGFYTSPWFANWTLQELDYFIKQELKAPHYMRYMDDMVIFSSNKRKLAMYRREIEKFLEERLNLRLREDWQIFRFDYITKEVDPKTGEKKHRGRPLDYMGMVFYRDRVILRESIMLNATRLAKNISKQEKPNIYSLKRMMAYKGYIEHTDTYNMYLAYIKPYVTFQYCQRRISKHDKRRNKEAMTNWKTSRSTVRPDEVDIASSKTTIYVRKNIRQVEVRMGEEKVSMFEYEEKQMTRAEFVAYADILETAQKALQSETELSETQNALLEIDTATDKRMTDIENCLIELDEAINK